jgi:HEAT repeat protein
LIKLQDPSTIPILIERVNDWVGVIRKIAQEALLEFLDRHPQTLIKNLPAIFNLQKRRRHDHSAIIKIVIDKLIDSSKPQLIDAITSSDPHLAFIAFKLCLTHKLATPYELIEAAITTKHITLARSVMTLMDQIDDKEFESLSPKLLQHIFSPLRNRTIKRLSSVRPERILAIANKLMSNQNEEMRKIGRKHLQLSDVGATEFYQKILVSTQSNQTERVVALIELTQLASDQMTPVLEIYAKSGSLKIRKVALQQLIKLKGEQTKPMLMSAILDNNISITKEAARLCYKNDILITTDELVFLAAQKDREHILDSVLLLAKKNGKWKQLIFALQLLHDYKNEDFVVKRINLELYSCAHASNRGSGHIPVSMVTDLDTMLKMSTPYLNECHYKTIRFMLDTN